MEEAGQALDPPSGTESQRAEKGREDGSGAERAGSDPLLNGVSSRPPAYAEERLDRALGMAGEPEPPERSLMPPQAREDQAAAPAGLGALSAPQGVLTPPEILEGRTDGEQAGIPERSERTESPALLRQVERLERAAAVSAGDTVFRRQTGAEAGYPVSLPGLGTSSPPGAAAGAGPAQRAFLSGALAADETRWAERADRVFRRDSRRYDGGFYLY